MNCRTLSVFFFHIVVLRRRGCPWLSLLCSYHPHPDAPEYELNAGRWAAYLVKGPAGPA
jgi:hypothetical protein